MYLLSFYFSFFFFTGDSLGCFHPFVGRTDHPCPAASHAGKARGRPRHGALRPQLPAEAAAREDRSPARAADSKHQTPTATGEINKQTNKQEHASKSVCQNLTNKAAPALGGTGGGGRAGWRGAAGAAPALLCPVHLPRAGRRQL